MSDKMRNALECCRMYLMNQWSRPNLLMWAEITGDKRVNALILRRVIDEALNEPERIPEQQFTTLAVTEQAADLISLMGGNG